MGQGTPSYWYANNAYYTYTVQQGYVQYPNNILGSSGDGSATLMFAGSYGDQAFLYLNPNGNDYAHGDIQILARSYTGIYSTIESLHKILKDETRRKIVLELNEKGSVAYTDLMDSLGIVSTGTLNYHLKVLGDLLEKDQAEKYMLSEKGKLSFRVLTEFPNSQSQAVDKMIYKSWIVLFAATIAITILNGYFSVISVQATILALIIVTLSFAFAFYIRIRPSHTGNRAFFIAVGTFGLGFVFWAVITLLILHSGLRWQILSVTGNLGDDFVVAATLIICWILGGWAGDLIGKRRNYVIPRLRV